MANRIRISTLGPRPPRDNPGSGQEAVDRMIGFWRERLGQVWADRPDLVVVPECCDRFPAQGAEQRQEYYRYRGDRIRDYFADEAQKRRCYITYPSVRRLADGTWRNSVQLLGRDGSVVGTYNKNYPVVTETTEAGILCGREAPVWETEFGRVGCLVCFDMNFDEILRRYAAARPDLLLFCSMYHGGLMQGYWAYACRAHLVTAVAGAPCAVLSPLGETLASSTNYFDYVSAEVNLDCRVAHLDFNWEKLNAAREKYGPECRVHDPGFLGSVLLSSEGTGRRAADIVAEFGIEELDDYMARSMAHRQVQGHMEPPTGEGI